MFIWPSWTEIKSGTKTLFPRLFSFLPYFWSAWNPTNDICISTFRCLCKNSVSLMFHENIFPISVVTSMTECWNKCCYIGLPRTTTRVCRYRDFILSLKHCTLRNKRQWIFNQMFSLTTMQLILCIWTQNPLWDPFVVLHDTNNVQLDDCFVLFEFCC